MTKSELQYVLNDLGIISDEITPALPMAYIVLQKYEIKSTSLKSYRFKFDMTNENLILYHVTKSPYSEEKLISKGYIKGKNYDVYDGVSYLYLCDNNKEPLVDVYDFSLILCITAK